MIFYDILAVVWWLDDILMIAKETFRTTLWLMSLPMTSLCFAIVIEIEIESHVPERLLIGGIVMHSPEYYRSVVKKVEWKASERHWKSQRSCHRNCLRKLNNGRICHLKQASSSKWCSNINVPDCFSSSPVQLWLGCIWSWNLKLGRQKQASSNCNLSLQTVRKH